MVVEDEPDIYELLLAMFEMWGIEGVAFVDGEEAVSWIEDVDKGRFRGELPELALLDIRLPGAISGPMVGERLRQSPVLNDTAIVLSTAYKLTIEEETQVIEKAGADKLMYKPLPKFNELQQQLEAVIAARRTKSKPASEPAAPVLHQVNTQKDQPDKEVAEPKKAVKKKTDGTATTAAPTPTNKNTD
jgi:CheY-like chemotaxis protein